jgi:hypothetical protein
MISFDETCASSPDKEGVVGPGAQVPAFQSPGIINCMSPGLPTAGKRASLRIRFGGQREVSRRATKRKRTALANWGGE